MAKPSVVLGEPLLQDAVPRGASRSGKALTLLSLLTGLCFVGLLSPALRTRSEDPTMSMLASMASAPSLQGWRAQVAPGARPYPGYRNTLQASVPQARLAALGSQIVPNLPGVIRPQRRSFPTIAAAGSSLTDGIVESAEGPLTKLTLTSASGASAEVFTMGATVTSFKAPSEVLFVRPDAKFDGSKPISGGLPFCWPQFGPGEIQQHGFARNCDWKIADVSGGPSPSVTFELKPSDYTTGMWNNQFKNTYTIVVGEDNSLKTTFTVTNTGSEDFTFTGALHSYFSVGDIDQTAVQGPFKGATVFDRMLDPPARITEDRSEVTVSEETDRCYEGVSGVVKIADKANERTIVISNEGGYEDTCVWSPYGNEGMGAKKFICVESGNVKDKVTVSPGTTWMGKMSLSIE